MRKMRALVLGTNAGQADLIRYLKTKNWEVFACGHKAIGPGIALADYFTLVDIIDLVGVEHLASKHSVDLVYSVSSDLAAYTAHHVSKKLQLPYLPASTDLLDLLLSKEKLRQHLLSCNLSPIVHRTADRETSFADWDIFPCVVKPSVSQGQRGISLIEESKELDSAIRQAIPYSKTGRVIVEEYLDGVEVSANVLLCDRKIVVNEITERMVHPKPMIGIPRGHRFPVDVQDKPVIKQTKSLVEDVIQSFNVSNGVFYFQLKLTSKGPRVVEIAPRIDGCHIWRLLEYACGYNILDLTVRLLLGERIDEGLERKHNESIHELMFQQAPTGSVFSSKAFDVPSDGTYHEYRYKDGDLVQPINGKLEVVGYYVRSY